MCLAPMYLLPNQSIFETLPCIVKAKSIRQNKSLTLTKTGTNSEPDGDFHQVKYETTTSRSRLSDQKVFKTIGEQTNDIVRIKVGVWKKLKLEI